jgi:hypothetical protein
LSSSSSKIFITKKKQKRALQAELISSAKQRSDSIDKQKVLELCISRKERDISDLLNKLNETISYYEVKLERKDEQIWTMTYQINEGISLLIEVQKNCAAAQAVTIKGKATAAAEEAAEAGNSGGVDFAALSEIEKKFRNKEKAFQLEAEKIGNEIKVKDEKISLLNDQIIDLTKKQFAPRMERLKVIERDLKSRMTEYALAEERMEVKLLIML